MLSEAELARLIVSWKNQCGEEIKGRFYVGIDGRKDMYKTLIKTLIETHGYTQEDLEGNTYRRVMEASVAEKSEHRDTWRKAATSDWNDAVDYFFPQKLVLHDPLSEPVREKFKKPQYAAVDPRLGDSNEIDPSIFAGLPPVVDPDDEDFLNTLKGLKDE